MQKPSVLTHTSTRRPAQPPDTPKPLRALDMTVSLVYCVCNAGPDDSINLWQGKIRYAQDSFGRHVAIKAVRPETDECRVLQFLKLKEPETLSKNCFIPVIELLPNEGFCFEVMPQRILILLHSILKMVAVHRQPRTSIFAWNSDYYTFALQGIISILVMSLTIGSNVWVPQSMNYLHIVF